MKKAKILLALVICACLCIPQGFAKDVWELAKSDLYKEKAGGMLGRGLLNAATSPVDIVVQTVDKTKSGPPLIGTLTGMASGLGCTALRASSGIVDAALFWVPGFNGFPVNRSYNNCLEEESSITVEPTQPTVIPQVEPIVQAVTAPAPIVTVSEEPAPVQQPKHVVRKKHSAYDYVKK